MFNMLTVWPRIMSMKSSLKMMRIQPQIDAVKKRYAHLTINDPKRVKMNAEMMALYKGGGANMFGGCLPLMFQMPLLFAYMRVLRIRPSYARLTGFGSRISLRRTHCTFCPFLSSRA